MSLPETAVTKFGKVPVIVEYPSGLVGDTNARDAFYGVDPALISHRATWTNNESGINVDQYYDKTLSPPAWVKDINLEKGKLPTNANASADTLEAANYTSADYTFVIAAKALLLDAAGIVKVDTVNSTGVSLPMTAGYNPIAATKIYNVGTDAGLTIVGLGW